VRRRRAGAASRTPRLAVFSPLGVPAARAYAPKAQSEPRARVARRSRRVRRTPVRVQGGLDTLLVLFAAARASPTRRRSASQPFLQHIRPRAKERGTVPGWCLQYCRGAPAPFTMRVGAIPSRWNRGATTKVIAGHGSDTHSRPHSSTGSFTAGVRQQGRGRQSISQAVAFCSNRTKM
jgi:hypothetical protein